MLIFFPVYMYNDLSEFAIEYVDPLHISKRLCKCAQVFLARLLVQPPHLHHMGVNYDYVYSN